MIYKVKLKGEEYQTWGIVEANSLDEVVELARGEYPKHQVVEVGEAPYDFLLKK
jgi:hypothetical protein